MSLKIVYDIGYDFYLFKKYKSPFDYYSWAVLALMIFISVSIISIRSGAGGNIYLLILAIPLLFIFLRKRNNWRASQVEAPPNQEIEKLQVINLYVLLGFVIITLIALTFLLIRLK